MTAAAAAAPSSRDDAGAGKTEDGEEEGEGEDDERMGKAVVRGAIGPDALSSEPKRRTLDLKPS